MEDNEGKEAIMVELQRRLSSAISSSSDLQKQLDEMSSLHTSTIAEKDVQLADQGITIVDLQQKTTEQNQAHGLALASRDAKISDLRKEIESLNAALKNAHSTILTLRGENHGLNFELGAERSKGQEAVRAMLDIMGYPASSLNGQGRTSAAGPDAGTMMSSSPVKGYTGLMTPASGSEGVVVRRGGLFDGSAKRRSVGGTGRKRRRYDSGLGFLSEGEEGEGLGMEGFSSDL